MADPSSIRFIVHVAPPTAERVERARDRAGVRASREAVLRAAIDIGIARLEALATAPDEVRPTEATR